MKQKDYVGELGLSLFLMDSFACDLRDNQFWCCFCLLTFRIS